MKTEKMPKKMGHLIKLRPEYEERYIILHRHTFPGVLDRIRKSNIGNYSIFLLEGILFSHYEYIGDDFEGDMKAIADPTTKDWWKLTDPMQEPLPTRKEGEWWAEMQSLLCLYKILRPSSDVQRMGLVAEVMNGKKNELRNLFRNFPTEFEWIMNKFNFQNVNIYYQDGKIYLYCEYAGMDTKRHIQSLTQHPKLKDWQKELYKLLVKKQNAYWQMMKEVFHTI